MTMIACRECGKQISDTAPACVGCGAPLLATDAPPPQPPPAAKQGMGWFTKLLLWGGGALVAILVIGSMQPETARSRARLTCDNVTRQAYTAREKAMAEEVCAELMREADKQMGRIPR